MGVTRPQASGLSLRILLKISSNLVVKIHQSKYINESWCFYLAQALQASHYRELLCHNRIMKNKRLVISILATLTVLTAAIIAYSQAQQPSKQTTSGQPVITDAIKFASEYKSVAEDNRFTYISGAQATELLQNGSGILFLGFEECPWCQGLAPLADEAAKAEDLSKINYLDIRAARETNDSDYQKLVEILKEY